jgi:hypothetical protein
MNWYKTSQQKSPEIVIISYDSFGDMSLYIGNKKYNYTGVFPEQYNMLKVYLKYKNKSSAFKLIRSLKMEPKRI